MNKYFYLSKNHEQFRNFNQFETLVRLSTVDFQTELTVLRDPKLV